MPESPRALDLRTLPPSERDEAVFRAFDALGPEETVVLVSDHDPAPLVPRFQAERPGRFDWNVLEAGPGRFRVGIRRRAVEGPHSTREYLQEDHRRLDGIVTRLVESVRGEATRVAEVIHLDPDAALPATTFDFEFPEGTTLLY